MLKSFSSLFRFAFLAASAMSLAACSTIAYKPRFADTSGPKHIAIFLDGTHNDEASDTNVKRLHSLVSLQNRPDIATLYVEGVGTSSDVLGMGMGVGFAARVKIAYEFILDNHYNPASGDKIYIFGFSRGAYASRALTSLLYNAGLPTWAGHSNHELADAVYDDVHGLLGDGENTRRDIVAGKLAARGIKAEQPVAVEVLGLWDSVEALGNPHWGRRLLHKARLKPIRVDIDIPNQRHGDQLCNVRHAYQALSVDDDREWVFTPLLLTRKALFTQCAAPPDGDYLLDADLNIKPGRLQEVWFSGAHSDVGGGYGDSAMSGVSLNWMLKQLNGTLFHAAPTVREDWYGSSHDPDAVIYHEMTRNLGAYVSNAEKHRPEFLGSLCVHPSVLARRSAISPKFHENQLLKLVKPGPVCLVKDDTENGYANPVRLKERTDKEKDSQCLAEIAVEVWPACKGGPKS